MEERDAYVEKREAEIKELQAELDRVKALAEKAKAEAKLKYQTEARKLGEKLEEARSRLNEIGEAAGDVWLEMRSSFDESVKAIRGSLDAAKKQISDS